MVYRIHIRDRDRWRGLRVDRETERIADALAEILLAGGWRSGAFLRYLAKADLDKRVALEYAMAASGDEA